MKNFIKIKRILSRLPGQGLLPTLLSFLRTSLGNIPRPAPVIDAQVAVVVAALIGPVALFIPWLTLDGHAGSLSGVGLMAYAIHGNDRMVMWHISPLATAMLLVLPFVITASVCFTTVNVLGRNYRLDAAAFTLTAILLLLRFTPPILDNRMYMVGHFALPGWGLAILLAGTLAATALNVAIGLSSRQGQTQPQLSP